MAAPLIVNQAPRAGVTDVPTTMPFRAGLRDADTRVDLSSVYVALLYAKAVYAPTTELPATDPTLLAIQNLRVAFARFNDAFFEVSSPNPCDQSLEVVDEETVYRIERTGGDQEGFLYLSESLEGIYPVAVSARIAIESMIPGGGYGSYLYTTYSDFTGVIFGIIHWPKNTGLFLFFRDNGTDKYITVAGPAEDVLGTRTSYANVVFDWSADTYTYKIFWDETPVRRVAIVIAVSSSGLSETVLAVVDTTTLSAFLASIRIGTEVAGGNTQRVAAIVGTDGPTAGDAIEVYNLRLFSYGSIAIVDGNRADKAQVSVFTTDTVWLTAEEVVWWPEYGTGTISTDDSIVITRTETDSEGTLVLQRAEPALAAKEWVLLAKYRFEVEAHSGTYDTGAGFCVEDGTSSIQLHLYDNFVGHDVGVLDSATGSGDVAADYTFSSPAAEWATSTQLILVGSHTRNAIRTYLTTDEVAKINTSYDSGDYPASSVTAISVGFFRDGAFYGTMTVESLILLPDCVLFEPIDGTLPEAQGWARTTSGSVTRSLTAADRLLIRPNTIGAYDGYAITDPEYDETSGGSWFVKFAITSRTDQFGTNTLRQPFGPVLMTGMNAAAVLVYFVQVSATVSYLFIPGTDISSDAADVIAQNTRGRSISTAVNTSTSMVLILEVKPYNHIRLFVDYAQTASIEILWSDAGFVLPAYPTSVPSGVSAAFGSLSTTTAITMEVAFARFSIGTGYDVAVAFIPSENALTNHIYGSSVDVLIDFQDMDP